MSILEKVDLEPKAKNEKKKVLYECRSIRIYFSIIIINYNKLRNLTTKVLMYTKYVSFTLTNIYVGACIG